MTLGGMMTSLQYLYSWRLRSLHPTQGVPSLDFGLEHLSLLPRSIVFYLKPQGLICADWCLCPYNHMCARQQYGDPAAALV